MRLAKSSDGCAVELRADSLPAEAFTRPAGEGLVLQAIDQVTLSMGIAISAERQAAMALALLSESYTEAEIQMAARDLCSDTVLDDKLRFGYTLTPADFKRVIMGAGGEAARSKLYTHAEALAWRDRHGRTDWPFERVDVEGKPMFRIV